MGHDEIRDGGECGMVGPMDLELDSEIEFDSFRNEFTGTPRESTLPPGPDEPICLISYEITFILLGDGPHSRGSFWRSYRRELALNLKTDYRNYHVALCSRLLVSLRLNLKEAVYFRNGRLTSEISIDPATTEALADPHFN